MTELKLILILAGLFAVTLRRPWMGVLALAIIGILHPQGYVGGAAAGWPVFKVAVGVLLLSVVLSPRTRSLAFLQERLTLLKDWRIIGLGILWLLYLNSTLHSLLPSVAWPKFLEISKVLATSLFALMLLDSRSKVEWFLLTVGVSIALLAFKGGYWALMTGSADRVYGPPGSQYYDNNHFAVLAVMGLPLIALHIRRARGTLMRLLLAALLGIMVVAILTSWSRGALLSLAATLTVLAFFTERRLALIPIGVLGAVLAFDLLPGAWFDRMESIAGYTADESAQGRIAVWRQGWTFALRQPFIGAGPDGWVWVASRDWHSAYVEVLAEHGFIALAVWLALLLGTLLSLSRCALLGPVNGSDACAAVLVAITGYAVGAAFLGLAYWDVYYLLLVSAVLLTGSGAKVSSLTVRQPWTFPLPRSRDRDACQDFLHS